MFSKDSKLKDSIAQPYAGTFIDRGRPGSPVLFQSHLSKYTAAMARGQQMQPRCYYHTLGRARQCPLSVYAQKMFNDLKGDHGERNGTVKSSRPIPISNNEQDDSRSLCRGFNINNTIAQTLNIVIYSFARIHQSHLTRHYS